MKIKKIIINNYRNINNLILKPYNNLNIIAGDNAQGKTNLLEAIFFLSAGYSFRNQEDKNLIKYDADSFFIQSNYEFSSTTYESSINFTQNKKKSFKINNKKSYFNNHNRLRVVLFTPDDLYLIKGSPLLRRNFIDSALKTVSHEYQHDFNFYISILKKRNILLKNQQANSQNFNIINDIFIEAAVKIIWARINFVNQLDETLKQVQQNLNLANSVKTRYALSFPIDSVKINQDTLKSILIKNIDLLKNKEKFRKTSIIGPHLDDIHIYIDDKLAKKFASQGQQRNAAVSLKLAELYTFKKIMGYFPIFLLDEVLSEFDHNKKFSWLDYLNRSEFQSFLTTVDLSKIDPANHNVFFMERGQLSERSR